MEELTVAEEAATIPTLSKEARGNEPPSALVTGMPPASESTLYPVTCGGPAGEFPAEEASVALSPLLQTTSGVDVSSVCADVAAQVLPPTTQKIQLFVGVGNASQLRLYAVYEESGRLVPVSELERQLSSASSRLADLGWAVAEASSESRHRSPLENPVLMAGILAGFIAMAVAAVASIVVLWCYARYKARNAGEWVVMKDHARHAAAYDNDLFYRGEQKIGAFHPVPPGHSVYSAPPRASPKSLVDPAWTLPSDSLELSATPNERAVN